MEPGIIGSYSTIMWTQIRHLGLFAKNYQWPLAYFVFSVLLGFQLTRWFYNVYLHPLAAFPGPLLWRASRVPFERSNVRGRILKDLTIVHAKYGEVVRVAPGILSFIHPSAWPDIYAHNSSRLPFPKDPLRYTKDTYIDGHPDVFAANDADHPRLRRILQPLFSEKAVREQEPLIQAVVDLLISQLRKRTGSSIADSPTSSVVDIATWMNLTTFDLIGDLAFGETFGCLARGSYHPWVALIVSSIKTLTILGAIKQFPWLDRIWQFLISGFWMRATRQHRRLVIEKVDSRLKRKTTRKDYTEFILQHQNSKDEKMSKGEMYSNLSVFIMAGSDTSATALSGTLYHLAKNPHELMALQAELRAKFNTEADITFESFAAIPTLLAALKESMRLYPSQPIFTPRKVPKGGAQVAEKLIPEGTTVGIFQSVAYNSPVNFVHPHKYDPSRWLGNPVYDGDRRDVFKPFSVGPKNCIGMQLAYAEIQLILARMLWNFDLELLNKDRVWTDQAAHWAWVKTPLLMKLKFRENRFEK